LNVVIAYQNIYFGQVSEDSLWFFRSVFLYVREVLNGMVIVVDNDSVPESL
jgi:hypothetical protein